MPRKIAFLSQKSVILFTLLTICFASRGNILTVTNTNNTGVGSLRDRVNIAVNGDTIYFDASLIASGNDSIVLNSEIAFSKSLVFKGLYSNTDTLFISGGGSNRIFQISNTGNVVLDSMVLINTDALGDGGAVKFLDSDTLFIFNSIIKKNKASVRGGGIYVNSPLIINHSSICENRANTGGGVYVYAGNSSPSIAVVKIDNSTINGNLSDYRGGGIYAYSYISLVTVTNSIINGNSSGGGGGIYSGGVASSSVNVTNSTIKDNYSSLSGGGVHSSTYTSATSAISVASVIVDNSTITGNSALSNGGGIFSSSFSSTGHSFSSVSVTQSTIMGNSADYGGGIYGFATHSSSPTLVATSNIIATNATITGNIASVNGGGIFSGADTNGIRLKGCILALNTANNIYFNASSPYIISEGFNIFSDTSIVGSVASDQLGVSAMDLNLSPLANNGGATETMLPTAPSVAIDQGDPLDLVDAQNAIIMGVRDIGAAEGSTILIDTITLSTCGSFSPPNSTVEWTTSGTYYDTLQNALNTVITYHLTVNNPTSGIDVQIACDSYTWIDGITYTTNNSIATKTLQNAMGCDSVVTLILILNQSVTSTDVRTACDSLTWIDGITYTANNNTATDTLQNILGCDSIVTLNLTLNQSTTGIDIQTACDSFTWMDGVTYTASNNMATDTLQTVLGCDSIITLNLTLNQSITSIDVQTACDSFTWMDGVTYTASNNTATDTLQNVLGCDSIITLNLTLNQSTTSIDVQTACDSFIWIDGVTYTASNNTVTDTLQTVLGCDSIITLDLTLGYSGTGIDEHMACGSYTWLDGITYTASNNTATHNTINSAGCDYLVTLNLTIYAIDLGVTINGSSITANETGVQYAWLNCDDDYAAIPGETSQTFTPSSEGNYAVFVNGIYCNDTSNCVTIPYLSIEENTLFNEVVIYPNPSTGTVSIDLNTLKNVDIKVSTINGKLVYNQQNISEKTHQFNLQIAPGLYFIELSTKEGKQIYKQMFK